MARALENRVFLDGHAIYCVKYNPTGLKCLILRESVTPFFWPKEAAQHNQLNSPISRTISTTYAYPVVGNYLNLDIRCPTGEQQG
jgi:hypothetical protein